MHLKWTKVMDKIFKNKENRAIGMDRKYISIWVVVMDLPWKEIHSLDLENQKQNLPWKFLQISTEQKLTKKEKSWINLLKRKY